MLVYGFRKIRKRWVEIKSVEERLSLLEKEVRVIWMLRGLVIVFKNNQWINSGMDELSNTVSRILKHIKL